MVDDGSSDDSLETIASYGNRVISVSKENGGQASAFNAGLAEAGGDTVIFLDADDVLLPGAVERTLAECDDKSFSKVHWQMLELSEDGRLGESLVPPKPLSQGDLLETAIAGGPGAVDCPPTSGNAWSRRFLDAIFPIPERKLARAGADAYLGTLAALYGPVVGIDRPLSAFRKHGDSYFGTKAFDVRMALHRETYDRCCNALERECRERGIAIDRARWDAASWICPLQDLAAAVQENIPRGQRFILIDDNEFDMDETGGRAAVQLITRDGVYWGPPDDDAAAIRALESHTRGGVEYLVLAPDARWWLDHYRGFFDHLSRVGDIVIDDERLRLYRLRPSKPQS